MNPTGISPLVSSVASVARPACPAGNRSLSPAYAGAIEALRSDLALRVRAGVSLQGQLHQAAGGFLQDHEFQRVSEQRSHSDKMEVILNILLEKGDAEFHTFLFILRQVNCAVWAEELEARAAQLQQAAVSRTVAVSHQTTSAAPLAEQAGPSSDQQAQLCQLQTELVAMRQQLDQALQRLADRDRVIAEQRGTIETLRQTVARLEQALAQACAVGQQPTTATADQLDESGRLRQSAVIVLGQLAANPRIVFGESLDDICRNCRGQIKTMDSQLQKYIDKVVDQLAEQGRLTQKEHLACSYGTPAQRIAEFLRAFRSRVQSQDDSASRQYNSGLFTDLLHALERWQCSRSLGVLLEGLQAVERGDLP